MDRVQKVASHMSPKVRLLRMPVRVKDQGRTWHPAQFFIAIIHLALEPGLLM